MTKPTTEDLARVADQIIKIMPEELEASQLVSLILMIMYEYFDVDQVPHVLRRMAFGVEADAEGIKKMFDDQCGRTT